MIKKNCEFEPQTIKAAQTGFAGDEISAHIMSCADCRETAKVARFLNANLESDTFAPDLPAAGFLWWKSKIIEKHRRAERVAQPILIAQISGFAIAFAAFVWLLSSKSSQIDWLDTAVNRTFASVESLVFPLVAGIVCIAFVCLLFVLALRRFFLEK
jgi:hypothetical protein